ncbi:phenoloxidase-activating factor 2-like [Anticarsia gemmatalis]|uniref:phenoloxidase-activating factor 2-like n=1 Tax=Anticarsia gemmatalis TaxID=129554 RepID=UPI003F767A50
MKAFLLCLLVGLIHCQSTIDPATLIELFGTPPTTVKPVGPTTPRYEDITVKPTDGTTAFVDKNGESCQCVPYYLCNNKNEAVDVDNPDITGYGVLDIRFGEDNPCQESVEVCCTIPKKPDVPKPLPDPKRLKGCGYRNPNGIGASFSGSDTQFGEFPWVVALLDAHNLSYAGVGVLINPEVVMTGAHIAAKFASGALKIRAGEWDTQTVKEIFPYEERIVQEIVIHKDFQPKSLKNDIALLRLDSPLVLADHINVICLPEQDEVFDSHKNCVANGWGKDVFDRTGRYAVILKKVEVDMVPYSRCNTLLKRTRLGNHFKLHDSFLCAGGEEGKDTCQGDGGAPLACPIGNARYKLTGLVAWGIGCGGKDVPAVYTNVPKFRDWVDDKMEQWGLQATSYRIKNDD